jgi:uncharacterized membrane protein
MDAAVGRHRAMLAVVGMLALGVVAGAVLLWPRGEIHRPAAAGQQDPTRLVSATLIRVQPLECEEADPGVPSSICIRVEARLADGKQVRFDTTDLTGTTFRAGQQVTLSVQEREGQPPFYNIRDLERTRPMLVLVAVFMLAVVAFGRWQGVRSLIGLALSFAVIVGFVVPAILRGHSPVTVALVGAMAIMLLSLYLSHGIGRKTTAAVVGTGLALVLTAVLTAGFVAATSLTGLASEDALNASFLAGGLSFRGLLLAGIILGGLGVLDDVTMSQASLVFELRRADPTATFGQLVTGALAVGRDHIAATVNTLFLAYAGASLPLLVLFTTSGDSLGTVATSEVVAVEIVRSLCGSIGLIAAVPLTTVLAAALTRQGTEADQSFAVERRPIGRASYGAARPAPSRTGPMGVRHGARPACATAVACRRRGEQCLASPGGTAGQRLPGRRHAPAAGRNRRPAQRLPVPAGPGRQHGPPGSPGSRTVRPAAPVWAVLDQPQGLGRGRSPAGRPGDRDPGRPTAGHLPPDQRGAGPAGGQPAGSRAGRRQADASPCAS